MSFKMCTNTNNYVLCFDYEDQEKQWGCVYRDDMIAKFEQDLYNKNFSLQNLSKSDQNDTLHNRSKIWPKIISNAQGLVPDDNYDYDHNDEALDCSVRGSERREFPKGEN